MWSVIIYFINNYENLVRKILIFITNHNILFVKLFQILSTNKELPIPYFKECTNHYSAYSNDIDHELLDELLTSYKLTLCSSRPINAGMIALVFKGFRDGKYFAIKMKRRNIESRLLAGYNELYYLYKFARFICYQFKSASSLLNLIKGFIDSKDHIMEQCEFDREIKAMNTFNWEFSELENIKNADKIVVPMVYNRDDEKRFIIMDFLEGTDCFHIPEKDKIDYLRLISSCMTIQIMFTSIIHTDPHPGNIIYMDVNGIKKLGIIDFGMHAYIDTDIKMDVAKGLSSLVVKSSVKPITYLRYLTNPPIQFDKYSVDIFNKLNEEALKIFGYFDDGTINEHKIMMMYITITQAHPDFTNLELNRDMVRLLIAFSSFLTTCMYLCDHNRELCSDIMKTTVTELVS